MPVPILKKIKISADGGIVTAELKFETLLLCTYRIDLTEAERNGSVGDFPEHGDNSNPEDDLYKLPTPNSKNDKRKLWVATSIIDQVGIGGGYKIDLIVKQGDIILDELTTGKKIIKNEDCRQEFFIVEFLV
ncbi:MAG: hypothetical protein HZB59_11150 [Ignavibacteriales bacterium]|nr:hypothetical protein [Ignavibacteriales bacterium]